MKSETLIRGRGPAFLVISLLIIIHWFLPADAKTLDIKRTTLSNGLTVLHVERNALPTVMITLLVKASPLDEPPDKAGLANLTAELLTEGTKNRTAKDISAEIEFIGASLGSSADNDYSTITLSVLKKDIEKGFALFSDVLLNPDFPENELKRIRDQIKGSLKQKEEEPSFLATRAFKKEVFGDLPYGRLVSGTSETIDRISREEIQKFYSLYYRPNNAVLSVVGDVTEGELNTLIARFLGKWKSAEVPQRALVYEAEKVKKTILIDRDLTQANIILGHGGIRREHPDYYAVSVMNYILGGGGFSSRLVQTVRDDLGLAYDIHSFFGAYKSGGLFEANVQTKNQSANTVIAEILKQMDKIRAAPVSDQELDDAKSFLTGSFPRRLDTNRKVADFLAVAEFYGLGTDYIERYPQYIRAVTKDDVLRVAGKYLDTERYILVVVAKQSEAKLDKREGK